jgi:LEA14-like dessication related protein
MKNFIIGTAIFCGVGVFGYSLYYYFKTQADLIKNFDYKIMDFGITSFNMQLVKGTLKVLFTSYSDIEIVIKSFFVDFYFDGVKVGYIDSTNEFIVPANGSAIIPFNYSLNPQVVFTNITDLIAYSTKQKDGLVNISGYAKVKSGFLTLTIPVDYETTISELMKK